MSKAAPITIQGAKSPLNGPMDFSWLSGKTRLRKPGVWDSQTTDYLSESHSVRMSGADTLPFSSTYLGCPVQAKLTVNEPGDKYEQEADRIAEQVMAMPDPRLRVQRTCAVNDEDETVQCKPIAETITPLVQRQSDPSEEEDEEELQPKLIRGAHVQRQENPEEEDEEELLQTKCSGDWSPEIGVDLSNQIRLLRGGGQPLPKSTRDFFEPRFGCDFSRVRVHADGKAAGTARGVQSRAFTVGHDVFFGRGEFLPETNAGKKLIAHELVHTVQQSGASHANYTGMPASQIIGLGTPTVQRVIPTPRAPDDETARNATRQIKAARRQLSNIDPDERQELEAKIAQAEAALERYRASRPRGGVSPMMASTTTGNPAGIIIALFALAAGLIFAQSASRSAAQRKASEELGRQLSALASALETAILMTAAGNVADSGIMKEVNELVAAGTAATVCAALEILMRAAKQAGDKNRIERIKATQKAKGCRHSRHSG